MRIGENLALALGLAASVVVPAAGAINGSTPRTLAFDLRNPGRVNQDLSIQRDFALRRTLKVRLGLEVFNLFDTVVFGGIDTSITNGNFGRVSSQINQPRVAQIKVRVTF